MERELNFVRLIFIYNAGIPYNSRPIPVAFYQHFVILIAINFAYQRTGIRFYYDVLHDRCSTLSSVSALHAKLMLAFGLTAIPNETLQLGVWNTFFGDRSKTDVHILCKMLLVILQLHTQRNMNIWGLFAKGTHAWSVIHYTFLIKI